MVLLRCETPAVQHLLPRHRASDQVDALRGIAVHPRQREGYRLGLRRNGMIECGQLCRIVVTLRP